MLLVALAGSSLLAGCGSSSDTAIDYEATEMESGDSVSVESFRGEPVLLVSWATWCKQCDEELSGLQAFTKSPEAEGIHIVAVNLDAASVEDEIEAKIERNGLTVTQWRDRRNDFKRTFSAIGVPTTVLLDADGVQVGTFPGGIDYADEEFTAALDEVRG